MTPRKKIRSLISALFISAGAATFLSPSSYAQAQTNNNPSANETLPRRDAAASITLPDERKLTIHAEDNSNTGIRGGVVYFHKPVFAFEENTKPLAGRPKIFWRELQDGDNTIVQVKIVLSTAKIQELARAAVIAQDKTLRDKSAAEVDVKPWPLRLLQLHIRHSVKDKFYGTGITGTLIRAGDTVPVNLKINTADFPEFLAEFENGLIDFEPSYTFNNAVVAFGEASTSIASNVAQALKNLLTSEQLTQRAPIFQMDVAGITTRIQQTIFQSMRMTDASIANLIPLPDINTSILQPQIIGYADMQKGDKALLNSVESYLKASVDTVTRTREDSSNVKKSQDGETTHKLGISYSSTPFSYDLTDTQKDKLETEYGIKLVENVQTQTLQPHSIAVNFLRKSWQDNSAMIVRSAFLAVGRDLSFNHDTAFQGEFTRKSLEDSLGSMTKDAVPFSGVQPGMAFCYFGEGVPRGYAALDGKTKFPQEKWAGHLRGKPVPNMDGLFMAGTNKAEEITGEPVRNGRAVVKSFDIGGGNVQIGGGQSNIGIFRVPPQSTETFLASEVTTNGPNREGIRFMYVEPGLGARPLPANIDRIAIPGGVNNVTIPEHPVDLSVPGAWPNHMKCRWVIRMDPQ
jgi:hypothetical protein